MFGVCIVCIICIKSALPVGTIAAVLYNIDFMCMLLPGNVPALDYSAWGHRRVRRLAI